MECRSCGAPLPPEAKTCPVCGTEAPETPRRKRKALHGLVAAAAAILVIAGVLLWYFITTDRDTNNEVKDAINDMRFSDAEIRMEGVHLFQPGDLELRKSLIAAGHEAEERENVALLQRISAIRKDYDASALAPYRGVIDQLEANAEPDLYVSLCTAYENGAYRDVLDGFETLAERSYERSKDYLFLTHAHLSDSLKTLAEATDTTEAEAEQRLLRLIGFADTGKLIFANDSYAKPYLEGYWESVEGSLIIQGDSATCNVPGIEPNVKCTVHDGAIFLEDDPETPVYTLEVFNANTLILDRVEDGVNCTLRKRA